MAASWRWVFLVNVPIGLPRWSSAGGGCPRVAGPPRAAPDALGALLVTAGVGALTLGLVKGETGAGAAPRRSVVLGCAASRSARSSLHSLRASQPADRPGAVRVRAFTGSSIVALLFSVVFGAMLLSLVLWTQDVWRWSALNTGLAIAPGPLMVPLFSFLVAGPLITRFGPGR